MKFGLSEKIDLDAPVIVDECTIEVEPATKGVNGKQTNKLKPMDDNLTYEQRNRDKVTTGLYRQFSEAHKEKQKFIKESKELIRSWCIGWVTALVAGCLILAGYIVFYSFRSPSDVVALIGALVPLVGAVIGMLNIVIKYVFPEDEEKYITEIVKIIYKNDLLNKQENIKKKQETIVEDE